MAQEYVHGHSVKAHRVRAHVMVTASGKVVQVKGFTMRRHFVPAFERRKVLGPTDVMYWRARHKTPAQADRAVAAEIHKRSRRRR